MKKQLTMFALSTVLSVAAPMMASAQVGRTGNPDSGIDNGASRPPSGAGDTRGQALQYYNYSNGETGPR